MKTIPTTTADKKYLRLLNEELHKMIERKKIKLSHLAKKSHFEISNLCRDKKAQYNHKILSLKTKAEAAGIKLSSVFARVEKRMKEEDEDKTPTKT